MKFGSAADRGAGQIAALLAREKACKVSACRPGTLVVGADQTLAIPRACRFPRNS
jgi:predicted house-cleaning NTP pyrophosphatase (Maf/HAM1 superfamily)